MATSQSSFVQDRDRYFKRGLNNLLKGFMNPCFRHMVWFRMCSMTSRYSPLGVLARILLKFNQILYGFQIPHTTSIGSGLFLGHYGTIVINPNTIIGENCNIAQGVTIGKVNSGSLKGFPVIGNRVWIGANAVLVGKIHIGNDVFIAPLSFVNFDVPDGCMVIGNPGRIIENKTSEGYINFF
jgi:serine O-acetyltransferase